MKFLIAFPHYFIDPLLDMAKKKGLWANIHAKRKRGEAPAKKGDKNYPETLDIDESSMKTARKNVGADKCWDGYKAKGTKKKDGKTVPNCVKEKKTFTDFCVDAGLQELEEQTVTIEDVEGNKVAEVVDLIKPEPMTGWRQQLMDEIDEEHQSYFQEVLNLKKTPMGDVVKDFYKSDAPQFKGKSRKKRQQMAIAAKLQSEENIGEAAWTKKEGQNKNGGLNEKGRKSYERENPGSDLKAPSKKVGNKRRASFCARMKGMRKRQKPENNTGDDRLSKSLRAWNC